MKVILYSWIVVSTFIISWRLFAHDMLDIAPSPYHEQLAWRCSFEDLFKAARIAKLQGNNKEALLLFHACKIIKPHDWLTMWELGDMYGLYGDLPKLWYGMSYRWKHKKKFSKQLWNGESLQGKRFLATGIWGFGDTFQYVRYLKILKKQGATIILHVQKPLKRLMQLQEYIDMVIVDGDTIPSYDYQAPLIHIPAVLNTTLDTIPAYESYLVADQTLVNVWRLCLAADKTIKVGICWKGQKRADPQTDYRPIPLKFLAPLAHIPGVTLYSLQVGDGIEDLDAIDFPVQIFGSRLDKDTGPFMDTAAIMKNLDVIITIDTSIAHLAGALGVPVWVLLPYAAENRFFLNRDDSPWYPSMRLFRQTTLGIWDDVVERVCKFLKKEFSLS